VNNADRLMLKLIRSGDDSAWQQFIDRYERRLFAYVNARLTNRATSEDVVQETFIGFLTSLPNFDEATPVESFLFSIAAHKLTDVLRKQGRRPTVPLTPTISDDDDRAFEHVGPSRKASSLFRSREDRIVEQNVIAECLQKLIHAWIANSEFERLQCAELLFVSGLSNKDVAAKLSLTEQAVANHKFFIVSKLKDAGENAHIESPAIAALEQ
jgi:RNA polymerase sigma-70 factor, ECF subfamily